MKIIDNEDKNNDELRKFLIEAKKNTYARSGEINEKKLEDGGQEFIFEKGKWKYRDRYFGYDPFIGQEVVWENGKAVWVMNYCGKILSDIISAKEIFGFLKKVLLNPEELIPLRGPEKFEEGDLKYFNIGGGFLDHFQHVESIHYKGQRVYELVCHGGLIK